MSVLLVTFLVMALFITVMAVGVIFGRAPLKGSCGGLNKIGIDGKCEICGKDPDETCESSESSKSGEPSVNKINSHILNAAYDATKRSSENKPTK